ncbi:MAG: bifunctional demethylmenaquinone methyltransferase/2-methoxy-6-polyprenyl-1,4-benzoquinol methylase UbiE [Chitinophagales bacterium]|nr:bifunctional demethylmenaquinone methyltransferase/2-methoxy-6-polyprenyl-1,4-benzoquinol methylase UbiE [Chitinophagales bacterium]
MSQQEAVTPYGGSKDEKKKEVASMFNNIAGHYDFLNHFLSVGIDKLWRRKVVKIVKSYQPKQILDMATGTGDLAIALTKAQPQKIVGVDLSEGMLEVGEKKVKDLGLQDQISMELGDSENILFEDEKFDAITVAFGVRNYENLDQGLSEMYRVLKNDSPLVVLEFSKPRNPIFRKIYFFYFLNVLPFIGRLISKDSRAYSYLPESVKAFPDGAVFENKLKAVGFKSVKTRSLTFGIASIYEAVK